MEVGLIFKIAAVGILVTILSQVLKHSGREEHAFLLSLAALILVLSWIVPYIFDLFSTMQMELVKVCAFALMGVLLALQFKGGKQEYGIYLGAALAVVVFSCTLSYMGQAKKQLMGLWQQLSGGQSYLTLLFKVVGITWISELVSGICKDSGYSAVASQVELFGKIAILFAGMPIFLALAETIAGFAGG